MTLAAPNSPVTAQPRRPAPVETAPLPAPALAALRAIKTDLQNVPRDCFVDRAEMLFWLRKMARRVEGVEQIRVTLTRPVPPGPQGAPPRPVAPTDAAVGVFGKACQSAGQKPRRRTITNRKGKLVAVETRQLSLSW